MSARLLSLYAVVLDLPPGGQTGVHGDRADQSLADQPGHAVARVARAKTAHDVGADHRLQRTGEVLVVRARDLGLVLKAEDDHTPFAAPHRGQRFDRQTSDRRELIDDKKRGAAIVVAVVRVLHVHHLRLRDVEQDGDVRLGQAFVPTVAQNQHLLALVAVVQKLAHREARALGADVAPRERELRHDRERLPDRAQDRLRAHVVGVSDRLRDDRAVLLHELVELPVRVRAALQQLVPAPSHAEVRVQRFEDRVNRSTTCSCRRRTSG